jgi:VanZ family protein
MFGGRWLNEVIAMPFPTRALRFLPPVVWMGLIALGSSSLLAGSRTGRLLFTLLAYLAPGADPGVLAALHFGLRKLGHVIEYGILAVLWYRALAESARAVPTAFLLAAAYGGVDELWQGLHPSRTPAAGDAVIDAAGALLGLGAWTGGGRWRGTALRSAAAGVWLLAGLATVLLVVDLALGRPATAPALAAAGLGLVGVGLVALARRTPIRVSSPSRAPVPQ